MAKVRSRLASLTLLDIVAGVAVSAAAVVPADAQSVPVYNWTGWYLGAHAGYRWAEPNFTSAAYTFNPPGPPGVTTFPNRSESYKPDSGIVGLHGGYNYQFAPNWLIGIEGDWTWGNGSDTRNSVLNVFTADGSALRLAITSQVKLEWQATIRGRLGYVQGPWLYYVTGGVAFGEAKWSEVNVLGLVVATSAASASKNLTGFAVGGGGEYMFNRNWIARIEYLYEDLGSFSVPFGFFQTGNLDVSNVHKVRVGISYKFN